MPITPQMFLADDPPKTDDATDRWRFAIEGTGDGVWDWNPATDAVWYSDRWKTMLGYEAHERPDWVIQWSERVHPDDRAAAEQALERHLAGETPAYVSEHRLRCKDGSYRWVLDRGKVVRRAPDGSPLRVVGTHTDITDRKQAEEALRVSEENYRTVTRLTSEYIFRLLVDDDGRITMDLATERLTSGTGRTLDDVRTPDDWKTFAHPEDAPALFAMLRRLTGHGGKGEFEGRFFTKHGALRWVHVIAEANQDPRTRRVTSIVGCVADVTQARRAEEERQRLADQLVQAQRLESVGRLAGGVAHDFNNMLGVILGSAELALDQLPPDHPVRADIVEVQQAASRSADLTRQLLAFARRQTVTPRVLDLNDTIGGVLKMLGRLMGEDVRMEWQPGEDLWTVRIDPSQVDQILTNLCVNARDAMHAGGVLTISTANEVLDERTCAAHPGLEPGDHVLVTVRDTGCGMTPDVMANIFEPFFTTKRKDLGTGLGLAMVYGIVTQNRGSVDVSSEVGVGSVFRILLPRNADPQPQAAAGEPASVGAIAQQTILVVEDERASLQVTRRMLERLGYVVLPAASPGDAMALAREHRGPIHLLLTDVVMPEMNGRDLARRVLSLRPDTRRAFMSGYTADVIAHHGVLDEGVCFLQKPFTSTELAAKVREALAPPA